MRYLTERDIIKINVTSIGRYSPDQQVGVRDANALKMTVGLVAQNVFGKELFQDIYSKAAIMLISIIKKHIFHNANKRTGWLSMVLFFKANGCSTDFPKQEGINLTIRVATYEGDFNKLKKEITSYLKSSPCVFKP